MEYALRKLTCGSGGQGGDVEVALAPSQSQSPTPSEEKQPPPSGQTFLFQGHPVGEAHAEAESPGRLSWGSSEVWVGRSRGGNSKVPALWLLELTPLPTPPNPQ